MPAPPEKKSKESTTISMVVEKWKEGQDEQFSATKRINGFPWHLRLFSMGTQRDLELHCEMSDAAELWYCAAVGRPRSSWPDTEIHEFKSWKKDTHTMRSFTHICMKYLEYEIPGSVLEVEIESKDNGEKWARRPMLDQLDFHDGILVIGKEKKKINVHKTSLASQSSFFDRLFFGDFKEKNMAEITIEDVEYEEFSNLLRMIYRLDGISLSDKNVYEVLHLAGRFDLKIVEDRCVNFLLSNSTYLSIHQKLLIAEQNNFSFLKDRIISRYTGYRLRALMDSPDWEVLSKETTTALLKRSCDILDYFDENPEFDTPSNTDYSGSESEESSR